MKSPLRGLFDPNFWFFLSSTDRIREDINPYMENHYPEVKPNTYESKQFCLPTLHIVNNGSNTETRIECNHHRMKNWASFDQRK